MRTLHADHGWLAFHREESGPIERYELAPDGEGFGLEGVFAPGEVREFPLDEAGKHVVDLEEFFLWWSSIARRSSSELREKE